MTPLETLLDYRRQVQLLSALECDLARAGTSGSPGAARAARYGESRYTNEPAAAANQAWDGIRERRDALAAALSGARRDEVLRILNTAAEHRTLLLLTLYYLCGLNDRQIADQLGVTREHINRQRNAFLRKLH